MQKGVKQHANEHLWGVVICGSGTFHSSALPAQRTAGRRVLRVERGAPGEGRSEGLGKMLRLMLGCRILAGLLGTTMEEGRDPPLGFCKTCGLETVGVLNLFCLVGRLEGHADPAETEGAVMERTRDNLVQEFQRLARPSKAQKISPLLQIKI